MGIIIFGHIFHKVKIDSPKSKRFSEIYELYSFSKNKNCVVDSPKSKLECPTRPFRIKKDYNAHVA